MKCYIDLTEEEKQLLAEGVIALQILKLSEARAWDADDISDYFNVDITNRGLDDLFERMENVDFGNPALSLQDYILELYLIEESSDWFIEMTLGYGCIPHDPTHEDYDDISPEELESAIAAGTMNEYGVTPDGQMLINKSKEIVSHCREKFFLNLEINVEPNEDIDVDDDLDP